MEGGLLIDALIYLGAAVILVPIAKKLGLGSVLGYLIAGMIIGPFVFGFIAEEGQELMHFAEFGVVMMLFLVGLELEPALLWRLRTPILGMGGSQVLLSTIIITGAALLFGLHWTQALALAMALSLSSTAIGLQYLGEKGLLQSSGGQSSFSVLLFQDIAVIPMLALMPLLAGGHSSTAEESHDAHASLIGHLAGWQQGLITLAAIGAVILAGRYVVPVLLRLVAQTRQRELLTGAALLIVVAVAVLMGVVGLSPALGAFIGGVVLANSHYKHELESDLDPFKGLLLGLFFMAVGASIDFRIIAAQPLLILGIVLGLMLLKAAVLFAIGHRFKLATDQNFLLSLGLSQTGEFAFVLLALIRNEGILDAESVGILLVVVALSMALTPLLMKFNEAWLSRKFGTQESVTQQDRDPDEISHSGRVILAGFGRFGAAVGRFLRANGERAVILDNDSDRVELLRRMGFEVYYGDATRYDLLLTAGAKDAEIIIIGLPETEMALELIETVKKHFPHLHIITRAFDYNDTFEFMDAGVLHIYQDTIRTGLDAAKAALRLLGFRGYELERHSKRFLQHDLQNLKGLAAVRHDEKAYAETVKRAVRDLELQLENQRNGAGAARDLGWDSASLVKDYGG